MRHLVLLSPGEPELALLSRILKREDYHVLGVVEPSGETTAATIARVLELPVAATLKDLSPPPGTVCVVPAAWRDDPALVQLTTFHGCVVTTAASFPNGGPVGGNAAIADTEPVPGYRHSRAAALLAELAMATGAGSASLMLLQPHQRVLLVVCAVGLPDRIVIQTCLPWGEGLAGRAVATGNVLRVTGPQAGGRQDPGLAEAFCHPLRYQGRIVGVVNLARHDGDPAWRRNPQEAVAAQEAELGGMLMAIATRPVLQGLTLHELHDEMQELRREEGDTAETLAAWAGLLAVAAGCEQAAIAVQEGDRLLVAEGDADGRFRAVHLPLEGSGWEKPLAGASCPVFYAGEEGRPSLVYLPLSPDGGKAAVALTFSDPFTAHQFRLGTEPVLVLLEDQLSLLLATASPPAVSRMPDRAVESGDLPSIGPVEAGAEILAPEALSARLTRELERCRRYHVGCGVVAMAVGTMAAEIAPHLASILRTTDLLSVWPDGRIVVVTPEESQQVNRMARRLVAVVQQQLGLADPPQATRAIYPGRFCDADAMLTHVLQATASDGGTGG